MPGEVVETQRFRVGERDSQHSAPAWQVPDPGDGLGVDAFVHESGQCAVGAQHTDRAVAGADQPLGGVHDRTQGVVEIQVGGDGQHGLDQVVGLVAGTDDVLDPVAQLGQNRVQLQLRQRVTRRDTAHDRALAPVVVRRPAAHGGHLPRRHPRDPIPEVETPMFHTGALPVA